MNSNNLDHSEFTRLIQELDDEQGHFIWCCTFYELVVAIAQIQLAMRHPQNNGPSKEAARRFVDSWIESLEQKKPGIRKFLDAGYHEELDE